MKIRGSERLNVKGATLTKVKALFAREGITLETKNLKLTFNQVTL